MGGGGFEPPKQFAADLQSVPFGHSGIHPFEYIIFSYAYFYAKADDRTRTDNLLITNQLLCQLSHIGILSIQQLYYTTTFSCCQVEPIGLEPMTLCL